MKIVRGPSALESLPMYGASADIVDGALLTIGITEETDQGCAIPSGAAAVDAIGVKEGLHDYSVVGDTVTGGTSYVLGGVNLLLPGALLAADYDLSDTGIAIASMQSTNNIRVTSSENGISDFFFYVRAGVGIGQTIFIVTNDDTDYVPKGASTTVPDTTSKLVKIGNLGFNLHVLSTDRSKLISTAAAGTATLRTLYSEIKYQGSKGWERLDPTKHHNLQGLNDKAVAFRSVLAPVNSWFAPID